MLQLVLTGEDELLGTPTALAGRRFELELPTPRSGQAEFLVLRTRFVASLRVIWRIGDRCQLYFGEEDDDGGRWWLGTVVADACASADPAPGPGPEHRIDWGFVYWWERYFVAWNAPEPAANSEGAPEATPQSHWEMFRPGMDSEAARAEAPHVADEVAARALGAVEALMAAPRFRLLADTPQPGDCYPADPDGRVMVWYTAQVRPRAGRTP